MVEIAGDRVTCPSLVSLVNPGGKGRPESMRKGGSAMGKLLVHLTFGPEAPTRAALALLVARSALDDGHEVSLFLAGDAVQLLRPATTDAVQGVGTGSLREHVGRARRGRCGVLRVRHVEQGSRARAPTTSADCPVQMATPNVLVQLAMDHDRVITY